MKKAILVLLVSGFICWGFPGPHLSARETTADAEVHYVVEYGDEASMNWTQKKIRAKGNGFGPERVKDLARRKILAKRAAELDAYRKLLEVIKGVRVTYNIGVDDMMRECNSIKTQTEGMLKGMQVVEVIYNKYGGCEITVEVNINEKGQFLLTALNTRKFKLIDNYPPVDWVALRNEVEELKAELAITKKTFNRIRDELIAANRKLNLTEKKLKKTDLEKAELKAAFKSTKKGLQKTRNIVDNFIDTLKDKKLQLTVNDKELALTSTFLDEKKIELDELWTDFKIFANNDQDALFDPAALQVWVQRIKDIQWQTGQRFDSIYKVTLILLPPTQNYTGCLIDARGLALKPILAPSILNENKKKLYGIGVIPDVFTNGAIVDYLSGDIEKAKTYPKIGNHPLVVKAIKVVNDSDIMISKVDAMKLSLLDELLEKQKVAILI
ncbi:MAG: hypothetical protein JSV88_08785 [Candidatus Aminicenantes bacterium]|nr:MAG: hypothetical protein JSV88_08785 [Candidatus Aminicenantes bacterium]